MPRARPEDRIEQLVEAATRVFIASGGFQRAQIRDVAKEMGVAKGTVYLYVESKEALFGLCLRAASRTLAPTELPIPTPPPGATVEFLRATIEERAGFPALQAAESVDIVGDFPKEFGAIVDELYGVLYTHRSLIRLIGASAHEHPELAELWYRGTRGRVIERLTTYLERRSQSGQLMAMPDASVAARLITQLIYWFSVQRFFDPYPEPMDEGVARASVREAVLRLCVPPLCVSPLCVSPSGAS